jgi:hypothetical protein
LSVWSTRGDGQVMSRGRGGGGEETSSSSGLVVAAAMGVAEALSAARAVSIYFGVMLSRTCMRRRRQRACVSDPLDGACWKQARRRVRGRRPGEPRRHEVSKQHIDEPRQMLICKISYASGRVGSNWCRRFPTARKPGGGMHQAALPPLPKSEFAYIHDGTAGDFFFFLSFFPQRMARRPYEHGGPESSEAARATPTIGPLV